MSKFSHLHVHTQFSLLDGAAPISGLYKKAIADQMPAIAISDHGNMFGVFEFVAQAYKHKNADGTLKVKPIVGCEFYITKDRHQKTFTKQTKDPRHHQILLAKNEEGYRNLVKLTSLGFIDGLYGKYPRIDKELIQKYYSGLIATTCCLGALVPQTILKQSEEEAENEFKWWLNIFQQDYYVELQKHNLPEQEKVNEILLKFAKKYQVKVIASNDSHYINQDDFNAHDILLCINTGSKLAAPSQREFTDDDVYAKDKRFAFPNDQFYFKTTQEMKQVFHNLPQAIDNTNEIVDKISLLSLTRDILLPSFPVDKKFCTHTSNEVIGKYTVTAESINQWEYLKHITLIGSQKRYDVVTTEISDRIQFELDIIKMMGYAGYFLIVSDFIRAGREKNVLIGPGRGSAAGSVVAFCIGITNIDPIKYNLLFERFLNPERKSMPDIDTDFDDEGRQKVIDYVVEKYGKEQVAQIITYGTMAAKMSIKDVARVMDMPLPEANAIAKLIPEKAGIKLKRLLHAPLKKIESPQSLEAIENLNSDEIENIKNLRQLYTSHNTTASKVLIEAERLEGSIRNTGLHAAGIIIAPKNLTDLVPVSTSKESTLWVTQINGDDIEKAGIIKMDFLGLKTLTIIKDTLLAIQEKENLTIDLDKISLQDEKTFLLYQQGQTIGTFQFESVGMQKYLRDLKPDMFADLIAMNALFRPGPLAYIPNYIARKHGKEPIIYDLPEMKEYLEETYGITVYQEQVMLLAQKLAGFSKGDADMLRKAMGKKLKVELDKMKAKFIEGALKNNLSLPILEKIWQDWEAFAQYAFNKSHATCYAYLAYQTAYLKAHYPSYYMAAVLNHAGSIEKITFFMEECKRMGLKVLGPDINESLKGFAVNQNGEIRFGLGGLKGVGEVAVEFIINERKNNGPYANAIHFIKRNSHRSVNKKTIESLLYAGALDVFTEYHRAQYFYIHPGETLNGLDKLMKHAQLFQSEEINKGNSLFGNMPDAFEVPPPNLHNTTEWPLLTQIDFEKEVTGIFLSGHPLDHYKFEITYLNIMNLADFNELKENIQYSSLQNKPLRIIGLIIDFQHKISKTGTKYGFFTMEDFKGKTNLAVFGDNYARFTPFLIVGSAVSITGIFKQRFNQFEFSIHHVTLAENIKRTLPKLLKLELSPKEINSDLIHFFEKNKNNYPGNTVLKFVLDDVETKNNIGLNSTLGNGIELNDELISYLSSKTSWNIMVETS